MKEAIYYFEIDNGWLIGKGADILKHRIASSQFFLLGEEHNMAELSKFVVAILPIMENNDYKHLTLEVGVHSAEKLMSMCLNNESLFDFNTKYYQKIGQPPIPFFGGKEDEIFLQEALRRGFYLWGIDLEGDCFPLYIIDELYKEFIKDESLAMLYKAANQFAISEYAKRSHNRRYPVYTNLLKSTEIKGFFEALPKNNLTNTLINAVINTWEIYEAQAKNNWYPRTGFMKNRFIHYYKKAAQTVALPKVFVKMGAVHTARGTSWNGFHEVGNTIYELAQYNHTESFSIVSFPRYRKDINCETMDILNNDGEKYLTPLIKHAKKDAWTLIDLKKIEILIWQKKITFPARLRAYIQKYDMIMIPPITQRVTPNYEIR